MANPEHLEILKQGVKVWNRWREENLGIKPDLSRIKLFPARYNLTGINFSGTNLSETDLRYSTLVNADLSRAILHLSDLMKCTLISADLSAANVGGVQLWHTDLRKAVFYH